MQRTCTLYIKQSILTICTTHMYTKQFETHTINFRKKKKKILNLNENDNVKTVQ